MNEGFLAAKEIGAGLAWLGFWIGLGLFNFQGQGCSHTQQTAKTIQQEIKNETK